MTWNEILTLMQEHHVAAKRSSWSGDKYIFYRPETLNNALIFQRYGLKEKDAKEGSIIVVARILIHTKDNKIGFYATTQCDMLADDWEISV